MTRREIDPVDEAIVRDHVAQNRDALRRAYAAVIRAGRGRVQGPVDLGLDPTVDGPNRWWARVRLAGQRGRTTTIMVEHHASGLEALDALGRDVSRRLARARHRRH